MPLDRIVIDDDPRIAEYRQISDPVLMRSNGLFLAEGRLVVTRLIEDGRYPVRSVLVNEAARRQLESTLVRLPAGVPIYVCEAADFLGITGFDIHRGCLAIAARVPEPSLEDVLQSTGLVVVLEGVANPDNVGGVFRNAAAFGAGAVLLSPSCCDPLYRKAIRTSMGAALRVPHVSLQAWPEALRRVRDAGFTLVALTPREPSMTLEAFAGGSRPDRLALIVGSEGSGLTPAVEAAADVRVRIPVRSDVDSLNLAVATGIALSRLSLGFVP